MVFFLSSSPLSGNQGELNFQTIVQNGSKRAILVMMMLMWLLLMDEPIAITALKKNITF